jgi:hypothetical protein
MFDKFGRVEGYGQMAPGRDLSPLTPEKPNGRPAQGGPDMGQAIRGGATPQGVFKGATQTIGAQPTALDSLSESVGRFQVEPRGPRGIAPGEPTPGMKAPLGETPANASISSLLPFLQQNYKHTPDDLKRAFAERPEMFQGANIMGSKGDKVQFADGKIFDIINSAGLGGLGWQSIWDNDPNAPPPQASPAAMQPSILGQMPTAQGGETDWAKMIMQAISGDPQLKAMGKPFGF